MRVKANDQGQERDEPAEKATRGMKIKIKKPDGSRGEAFKRDQIKGEGQERRKKKSSRSKSRKAEQKDKAHPQQKNMWMCEGVNHSTQIH